MSSQPGGCRPPYRIRLETPADHDEVVRLTRQAFWNVHVPGCSEHYLVHRMRRHADVLPELALVLELDGRLVGSILYTRARLVDGQGREKPVLSFGPLSILPEFQRRGLGKALVAESFARAVALGHDVVVIFGNPANYVSLGFRSCVRHSIAVAPGVFPAALLVRELVPGALPRGDWLYRGSPVYEFDAAEADAFDTGFDPMPRLARPSQEEFFILSRARVTPDGA
ncbi:GNAT family N-acetyltransferase [Rubrivivax gelatinosus]|uniref:Putative N-acetyltransferase n=1 Tax=Rubrivivax gelatinosus (strain NBRC 100245 / IL144) TaxID=983917 RepID=I0HSL2_RUBGI|nr:N-acetyltransferase [Rubrivivax gelatinosus]BAL95999.1 putative N-acetyltransferase [Rubrivivax gelatinosus IL144]